MSMPVIIPGTITQEGSVGDIIESIAMEETSISHILNAEGEKLQAIINKESVSVSDLLAANQSVKDTVDAVIQLELNLQKKLSLFTDIICKLA